MPYEPEKQKAYLKAYYERRRSDPAFIAARTANKQAQRATPEGQAREIEIDRKRRERKKPTHAFRRFNLDDETDAAAYLAFLRLLTAGSVKYTERVRGTNVTVTVLKVDMARLQRKS